MAAALMLVGGVALLILGIIFMLKIDAKRGLNLIILGGMLLCPGCYASTILFGAYRGWRGYRYTQVPSWDD
eukprot:CAMPEP_0118962704 /NCGR_PEP_ID=MMETSP1173-20130426/940_1 /TAXON_ID=1034831 /ORGANISM="Rhizochromulina marina cf, Strain CCMP1243" /LENGTH=70 /DNA_ID=CAMNT_0006910993 /DNA_START=110 /DNA_END=322 /DNA_ORIENTATION=+